METERLVRVMGITAAFLVVMSQLVASVPVRPGPEPFGFAQGELRRRGKEKTVTLEIDGMV
jgi:hypothetical protein